MDAKMILVSEFSLYSSFLLLYSAANVLIDTFSLLERHKDPNETHQRLVI